MSGAKPAGEASGFDPYRLRRGAAHGVSDPIVQAVFVAESWRWPAQRLASEIVAWHAARARQSTVGRTRSAPVEHRADNTVVR